MAKGFDLTIKGGFSLSNTAYDVLSKYVYNRQFKPLCQDAVKEFLRVMADNIDVDTGMTKASLGPMAAQVRFKSALFETMRGKGPKRGHRNINDARFADNIGPFKSRALGERLGQKAYRLDFGSRNNPSFSCEFWIVVFQHYLNEFNFTNAWTGKTSEGWASVNKGLQAALLYLKSNWTRYFKTYPITAYLQTGQFIG